MHNFQMNIYICNNSLQYLFQQWFKRRRKADQKRGKEVMRGDPSGLLSELKKVRSTFQLLPTSKALEEEGPKGNNTTEKTLHGEPKEDKKMIPVTKKEPGPTPFVWPHPRDLPLFFGVPSMECVPYAFPALKSTIRTTPTKTPTKEVGKSQFTPALLESSCAKSNIRIRDPFEEDPTPTKKRRKLSNDAMRASVDTMMEDILGGTSHLLPHIDSFLWSKEGPRFT